MRLVGTVWLRWLVGVMADPNLGVLGLAGPWLFRLSLLGKLWAAWPAYYSVP